MAVRYNKPLDIPSATPAVEVALVPERSVNLPEKASARRFTRKYQLMAAPIFLEDQPCDSSKLGRSSIIQT